MIEKQQNDETIASIEELDQEETLEVGGGVNPFDDLYAYLKLPPKIE